LEENKDIADAAALKEKTDKEAEGSAPTATDSEENKDKTV